MPFGLSGPLIINHENLNIDDNYSDVFVTMCLVQIMSMLGRTNKTIYINVRDILFSFIIFSGILKTRVHTSNNYIVTCLNIQDDTLFTFKTTTEACFISRKILYSTLVNQGICIAEIDA